MKKFFTHFSLMLIVLMFCALQNVSAQRVTIAGWTFPSVLSTNVVSSECGTGTIYADGSHGSSTWGIATGGTQPGLYFSNAGTAPTEALCEVTTSGKSMQANTNTYNDSSWVFVVSTNDYVNIQMSYNSRGTSAGFTTQTWSHSIDGVNFTVDTVLTGMNSSSSWTTRRVITFADSASNQSVLYIKLTFSGASSTGNNRLDNFCISGESDLPITAQPVFSQTAGNYCNATTVEITCTTPDAIIYYTTDGSTPDSLTGTLYTAPVNITTTTTLQAIAYATGLEQSAVKSADFVLPTICTTISEFFNDSTSNYFKITGDLTVLHKTGSYLFVQDASDALCIYGSGMTAYTNGQVISGGVCGTKGNPYYGLVELTNPDFQNPTAVAGTPVDPVNVTIAELNSNFDNYNCRLVTISAANFQAGTMGSYTNATLPLMQGTDTVQVSNQFRVIDGLTVTSSSYDVTGIAIPHDATRRICPRGDYDVVARMATIAINAPAEGQVFEQGDNITPDITTAYFAFENGAMIRTELSVEGQNLSTLYFHDATEWSTFTTNNLANSITSFGACQLVASLVQADSSVIVSDTVNFSYTAAYIAIETSESTLNFTETGESHTFTATAFRLSNNITLTTDNADFIVTPATLNATANGDTVTVTFNGTASSTGILTLTSDSVVATVTLNAEIPIDTVIYTVGFEEVEEFTAANVYNSTTIRYDGPAGQQWGSYYGTTSTSYPIMDAQSMQMRWYTANPDRLGYAVTNFDLHNVTKVEFQAKYRVQKLNLRVSRSFDGGATYGGDSVYSLTTTAQHFTYFVSDSGQYYSTRLKFQVELDSTIPTNTSHLTIDDVVVYGVTGLEPSVVETPVISEPSNSYINGLVVTLTCATEGATIYYTTDGTTPDETSLQYTNPFYLDTTCTLKARAFKGGMDPSNVAFANYVFPTQVANIAEFKAAGALDNSVTYKITGTVTFVYRSNRRIFIEDATGGLLVYDNATPVITRTYNEGDVINGGLIGTYSYYGGMNEMIPAADWEAATGTATVTPVLLTAQNVTDNFATYEARLVRINAVTFPDGVEFTQSEQTEATAQDSTGSVIFRNQFMTLDTTLAANASADIIGLASIYVSEGQTTYQLFPRTNADIIEIDTTGIAEAVAMNVNVFPNPTTGIIHIQCALQNNQCEMQLCDLLGRVILSQRITDETIQLDLSAYTSGMYLLRFVDNSGSVSVVKVSKR